MSKRPPAAYREDEPGRHLAAYHGREFVGHVIARDHESHAYTARGGLVGTFGNDAEAIAALRQARLLELARAQ